MISRLLSDFASILFPECCLVCGARLRGACLCHRCMPDIILWHKSNCLRCDSSVLDLKDRDLCEICRTHPPIFRRLRSALAYDSKTQAVITAMKYSPSLKLCRTLGKILGRYAATALWTKDWDLIVPIPSSPQSLKKRGFNQAYILAHEVQASLRHIRRIPISLDILSYSGTHKTQACLPHNARLLNARRMFSASVLTQQKKVLIVDDVLTTGATSSAAAQALLGSGALVVDFLSLARSNAWNEFRAQPNSGSISNIA